MFLKRMPENSVISVIGHGSWATAIVKLLLHNKNRVNWYVRNREVLQHIQLHQSNPRYLSDLRFFSEKLTATNDINEAIESSDIVVLATPSAFIKEVMKGVTENLKDKIIVSAIKGIVPDSYITIAEYLNQDYGVSFGQIGIIAGPCHAEEVALERLSYLTIACKDEKMAQFIGTKFNTDYIRIVTSTDIYGTEYAAVLKNIYAIAVGICNSLGYGDNFISVLISNAAVEMERFLSHTYPYPRNVFMSAYLGDLLVTCYSQFSRNRAFGIMIGKGYSVTQIQAELNMVAEGYYATACIQQVKNRCGIGELQMPIADAIYAILYQESKASKEIQNIISDLR